MPYDDGLTAPCFSLWKLNPSVVLALQAGDSVFVLEAAEDDGWYIAEKKGKRGLVPATHVVFHGHDAAPTATVRMAQATHTYTATNPDELSFKVAAPPSRKTHPLHWSIAAGVWSHVVGAVCRCRRATFCQSCQKRRILAGLSRAWMDVTAWSLPLTSHSLPLLFRLCHWNEPSSPNPQNQSSTGRQRLVGPRTLQIAGPAAFCVTVALFSAPSARLQSPCLARTKDCSSFR